MPLVSESIGRRVLRGVSRQARARPATYDRDYFERVAADTPAFLARFGRPIDFASKRVLELGSGHGASSIYLAQQGAARVVGVDINESRLAFARQRLADFGPDLQERVTFVAGLPLDEDPFDIVLSKDVLEHVADVPGLLGQVVSHLAPNGQLAMGWGPLWYSPYGGHIRFMTPVPWLHLLLPERVIAQERARFRPGSGVSSIAWVNKLPYAAYERAFSGAGLTCLSLRTNVFRRRRGALVGRLLNTLRQVSVLREHCTVNVYGVWARSGP